MKMVVFAHTPPPHHGQSYMVQLMLEGFGGDARRRPAAADGGLGIECYHVNARFSRGHADIGMVRGVKVLLVFWYGLQAIWLRFRYGVKNFYYVPAPGKRMALYRDWLVMWLCRPFFSRVILHWHAAGLAQWLETAVQIRARALTYRLFKPVDLSIVLSRYNFADAEKLLSRRTRVVNNGIPDPCPDFAETFLPRQRAREAARRRLLAGGNLSQREQAKAGGDPHVVKVLYLAHCMREKGLFDALEGVRLASQILAHTPLQWQLIVAGAFVNDPERLEFDAQVAKMTPRLTVKKLGFVEGRRKWQAYEESDLFCFPTYYHAESFGLVVAEAMAFGLPVVTTRWRSLPELFPVDYPGLVPIQSPARIAEVLVQLAAQTGDWPLRLRRIFQERFTLAAHLTALAAALQSVETSPPPPTPPNTTNEIQSIH